MAAALAAFATGASAAGVDVATGQTYTVPANPTTIDYLNIAAGGTVQLNSNALLVNDNGVDTTWAGIMLGTTDVGSLHKIGDGTVTLQGFTTAGGELHIDNGTAVQNNSVNDIWYLSIGSAVGSTANLDISDGTLNIQGGPTNGTATPYPALQVGDFGGTGIVTQTGGTVNLTNASSLNIGNQGGNGTYTISGGVLDFHGGFLTLGRSNGTRATNSSGTLNISGDALVDVHGPSGLIIGNREASTNNTTTGTINQTGGTLRVRDGAALYLSGHNSASTYNLNGGTLQIGGTALQPVYTPSGGGGTYQFNLGGGTIDVIGSALNTSVNASLVGGTTSSIDTELLGAIWTGILSNTGVGGGNLRKTGDSTLTLTQADTYSGTNYIDEGTLALTGAGSVVDSSVDLESSGTAFDISGITPTGTSIQDLSGVSGSTVELGTKTLTFGTSANTTFNGNFDGTGSIEKDGTGTFSFGGNAGSAQSFTVAEGTLLDTASNSFNGVGTFLVVGGATWDLGGAGTQTFAGTPGSVTIGNSATVNATLGNGHDNIVATTVTISNAISTFPTLNIHGGDGNFDISTPYLLISSSGLTGTFGVYTDDLAFLDVTPDYVGNDVYLDFAKSSTTFNSVGVTPNEKSVGSALDGLDIGNDLFDEIATLSEADALAAIDSMEGDIHASTKSVLTEAATYIADATEDHIRNALGGAGGAGADMTPMATSARPGGPGLWISGYGHSLNLDDPSGNAADVSSTNGGLVAGLDFGSDGWIAGVGAGYDKAALSADSHTSSANVDGYTALAYAATKAGLINLSVGGSYTGNAISSTRTVVLPTTQTLTASYNGSTTQAFGEVGIGMGGFEPFAGANYIGVATDGFGETGGSAAITAAASNESVTFTTLGVRARLAAANGLWLSGMAGWRHAFGDVTPVMNGTIQAQAFAVDGAPIATDAFVAEAGIAAALGRNGTIGVSYLGQMGANAQDHGAKATATLNF